MVEPKHSTLTAWLATLGEHGDAPAVLQFGREKVERWSFDRLDQVSGRFAGGLRERQVGPEDRVALLAPPSGEWIAVCVGAIRAGAALVPIDVQMSDEALEHVLRDSDPRLILAGSRQVKRLEELCPERRDDILLLEAIQDSGDESELDSESGSEHSSKNQSVRHWRELLKERPGESPEVEAEQTAVLFYTSGTTGPPKGVPLTHHNLVTHVAFLHEADLVEDHDRILLPLPLHHVYPFVVGMLTPLTRGLPLALPYSLTGPQLMRAIQAAEATILIGVPRLYQALYSGITDQMESMSWPARWPLRAALRLSHWLRKTVGWRCGKWLLRPLHQRFGPTLRVAASGGSPLDESLAWRLEGLGWQVGIGYGLTETSPLLTLNPPGDARLGSVGRPISQVELRIEEPDESERSRSEEEGTHREKNDRRQGEILARGDCVFQGYRNLPEKTEKAFTDEGFFRTGDLGFFDDRGDLHVSGRKGTMIVTPGGENVQPEDVEEAYAAAPEIREIGVLSDDERLVALVVPNRREVEGEMRESVEQALENRGRELPSYQQLSDFRVTREALPRTRLGKIQRHKLRSRYERAGEEDSESGGHPISIEEMTSDDRALFDNPPVRKTWDMLAERYSDQRLTPDTHLNYDLGLDSLDWVDLSLAIRREVGFEIDEEAVSRIEDVRDLLEEVANASTEQDRPAETSPLEEPEKVLGERQRRYLQPHGRVQAAFSRVMFALNRWLMRIVFRLEVEGAEHVPEGPCVIAPNHTSTLDAPSIAAALPGERLRQTYWGGWTGIMFRNPLIRLISRLAHVVPVDPRDAALSSLAFGSAALGRKHILVWFPEGQRSREGRLLPFRPGIAMLLQHSSAQVVPTVIEGAFEAWPLNNKLPRPHRIRVRFGAPRTLKQLTDGEATDAESEDVADALREIVLQLQTEMGDGER